jgi:kumamolisin
LKGECVMNEKFVDLPGSYRPRGSGAQRLRDANSQEQMEVTVVLRAPKLPTADDLPARPLSSDEFRAQYGASQDDANKVADVLKQFGLKIDEISLVTHSMRVSGTVAQMENAFHTGLGVYSSPEQGEYRGREGSIQIPAELNGIVTYVAGLDQRRVAHRKSSTVAGTTQLNPLQPADLETHYNFPPGDGTGQTIAIAEFGGGYFQDDLQSYCTKFNRQIPHVQIQSVNLPAYTLAQIQQLPSQQQKAELYAATEVMMDVQIIAGLCPGATIIVYFATFDQKGWIDLLNQVVAGNPAKPVALSVSWGMAEDNLDWAEGARDAINKSLQAAAMLGITVCASAGDDGSGDQMVDTRAHVDFPGSSPFVLGVGGTMLTNTTETVWWQSPGRRKRRGGGGATGGGVSACYDRPVWQNVHVVSLNDGSIDGRVVPDVTALAGPPLYDLILLGQDKPNGGTSASTPLWAALIGRINALLPPPKQQQFLTPLLYQNGPDGQPRGASGCIDITTGKNVSRPEPGKGYKAGKGYDAVSGWGTPDGKKLLQLLS